MNFNFSSKSAIYRGLGDFFIGGNMRYMNFNEYQKEAKKTAIYPNSGNNFIHPTLGLNGEAGEVAEKIKKDYEMVKQN